MLWRDIQHDFVTALRNPDVEPPSAVAVKSGQSSRRRFNVYRNNVTVSLIEALGAGYPVVKELVGEDFFNAMARAYVSVHLPASPVLLHYGDSFTDFIAAFEPAAELPFLADVARVESAWTSAYHAQDCDALTIADLQSIAPEHLEDVIFRLHPSLQLLHSNWSAVSIWQIHQTGDAPSGAMQQLRPEAEYAMIVRPGWDVDIRLLPETTWKFFSALHAGSSLGSAVVTLAEAEMADVGQMLQLLFDTGSVVEIFLASRAD